MHSLLSGKKTENATGKCIEPETVTFRPFSRRRDRVEVLHVSNWVGCISRVETSLCVFPYLRNAEGDPVWLGASFRQPTFLLPVWTTVLTMDSGKEVSILKSPEISDSLQKVSFFWPFFRYRFASRLPICVSIDADFEPMYVQVCFYVARGISKIE